MKYPRKRDYPSRHQLNLARRAYRKWDRERLKICERRNGYEAV